MSVIYVVHIHYTITFIDKNLELNVITFVDDSFVKNTVKIYLVQQQPAGLKEELLVD